MNTVLMMAFGFLVTLASQPVRAEVDTECLDVAMNGVYHSQVLVELSKLSKELTVAYALVPTMETDATLNKFIMILQKARSSGNSLRDLDPKLADCTLKTLQKQNAPK